MSETFNGGIESIIPIRTDPSIEDVPAAMLGSYADMNASIAQDNAAHGSTVQALHLAASRRDIVDTAEQALRRTQSRDERTAVILGAGGCFDIPLEWLVADFTKTTLVDIHTEQTERALSRLSPKLLGKVSLVQAELSGLAKGISQVADHTAQESNYSQFLHNAAAIVRSLNVVGSQVELGGDYAFTCSQLLMTQLCSIPYLHLGRVVRETYRRSLTMQPGFEDDALIAALNDQSVKVQSSHIWQLAHLTSKNGTIHFADTWGERRGAQILPMISSGVLKAINMGFDELRKPNIWQYVVSPQKVFLVGSYALSPKANT